MSALALVFTTPAVAVRLIVALVVGFGALALALTLGARRRARLAALREALERAPTEKVRIVARGEGALGARVLSALGGEPAPAAAVPYPAELALAVVPVLSLAPLVGAAASRDPREVAAAFGAVALALPIGAILGVAIGAIRRRTVDDAEHTFAEAVRRALRSEPKVEARAPRGERASMPPEGAR